jgi:hypothetical protein
MQPELHEMIPEEEIKTGNYQELEDGKAGKYYVIFPPLPAVILMPFVALFGSETNQSTISMLIAALSVAVSYLVFKELLKDEYKSYWLTATYAFGSMLWYHAVIGSAWYFAHSCELSALWLSIYLFLKNKNPFYTGLVLGLAYLSRFPLILAAPFFIFLFVAQKDKAFKNILLFLSGLLIPVLISLGYNFTRYGQFGHLGYKLLELRPYNVENEYSSGSYSFSYLSRNLKAMFWSWPEIKNESPYIVANMLSMSLWFVFPAIFIVLKSPLKNKFVKASLLAIAFILPSTLFHGGVGASQFGYRYALDFLPFVFILILFAIKDKFFFWQKALFVLSILINLWGVWTSFWI